MGKRNANIRPWVGMLTARRGGSTAPAGFKMTIKKKWAEDESDRSIAFQKGPKGPLGYPSTSIGLIPNGFVSPFKMSRWVSTLSVEYPSMSSMDALDPGSFHGAGCARAGITSASGRKSKKGKKGKTIHTLPRIQMIQVQPCFLSTASYAN